MEQNAFSSSMTDLAESDNFALATLLPVSAVLPCANR